MQPVLLLNASYEPLQVISWQNAVGLFFLGKVEVVEEYDHHIRSVSMAIKAPCVVRLLKYFKIGRRSPPLCRSNILARDNFQCQYCGQELSAKECTLDHVIPRSRNGKTSWENIVCACSACNKNKRDRTPNEAHMKLRSAPRKPEWLPVIHIKLHGKVPTSWFTFLQTRKKPT